MTDRQLPHPWQWLSDAEPEPGQQCEWVLLAPWGPSQGTGSWKVINGVDWPRFYVPGKVIKGFEDDKGLMHSDPSFTAWMPSPIQSAQSGNSTIQERLQRMTDSPQLIGGPADGSALAKQYEDASVIQVPMPDGKGNFATYARDLNDPSRYLFQGFAE